MRVDSPEFKKFLTKWRDAITHQSRRWEGPQAVNELKRETGYLDFICCRPDERPAPRWMLKGILDEVEDYRTEKKIWQKDFKDTELLLAKIGRQVELRAKKTATAHLKNMLHQVAVDIEKGRAAMMGRLDGDKKGSPLADVWEQFWPRKPRVDAINRGIELDTRLQFQCAKMFRIFLRAVSVPTIARLIVLVYWTTELAIVTTDGLSIVGEKRPITPRNVHDKLSRKKGKLIIKEFPKPTREISLDEIPWARAARKVMAVRKSSPGSA
jgi:hypothetical protein